MIFSRFEVGYFSPLITQKLKILIFHVIKGGKFPKIQEVIGGNYLLVLLQDLLFWKRHDMIQCTLYNFQKHYFEKCLQFGTLYVQNNLYFLFLLIGG